MESLLLSISVPLALGFAVSMKSRTVDNKWWDGLNKPFFTPPKWCFKFVWAFLYITMGWGAHLVAMAAKGNPDRAFRDYAQNALIMYWIQFIVSSAWAPLFFKAHKVGLAWGSNVLTSILIGMTVNQFADISPNAALLMTPYLVWVVVSGFINLYIVIYN
ncbi:hypothetical protein H4R33_002216 [Dimargaris cristalligena]|uniref:TspO/MBR-related protein n=1 Tax=Dimargaris cristalligena TaxID=215637 RepID=A0A4P9ZK40_9FUNG|nr:hypothetical protein H4R33_002216 [Dimargaris cristalligena]RKP33443.1 TspO/MBR-related protein [Dimargaris cristalligena]|eukprot:RKP33443.1 TspO/MBR-related protein [Dimargaris cristalligena]